MTDDEINSLYNAHAGYIAKVFRLALLKQRDAGIYISKDDEDEIWSFVLAKVACYLPRYNSQKSAPQSYIYTIVTSQVKWCLIRMRGMEGRFSSEAWNNSHAHYDDPDQAQSIPEPVQPRTVDDVLATLPDDIRQMAEHLLDGRTRREAARLMGWSRREMQAKLQELRDHLTDGGGTPPQGTPQEAAGAKNSPDPIDMPADTAKRATVRPCKRQGHPKPRRRA